MGFQRIERPIRGSAIKAPILIALKTGKTGSKMVLSFSGAVARELNWCDGLCFEILRGDGPDKGWLKLKRASDGWRLVRCGKRSDRLRVTIPAFDGLPAQHKGAEPSATRIPGAGELLIQLPFELKSVRSLVA